MLSFVVTGDTHQTDSFLQKMIHGDPFKRLHEGGRRGVTALRSATPHGATGLTASGWGYEIERTATGAILWWTNTNVHDGFNVAIGLQYGHGTGTGGWVEGEDYINPALKPIFDQIANDVWEEVQKA